jgi:conjugal transfer mating pair stabilization protein TraN
LTSALEKPHLTYVAGDYWNNGCAAQEAQTIGMPADGVNPEMDLVMPDVAMIGRSQCVRTHSTCVDSADRVIDGQNVHRACWQWRSSFACATLDAATSTCDDGTVQHCTQVGAFDCAVPDGQGACLRAVGYYECKLSDAVYEPTLDCGGQNYCYGNSCYDTSYSQDQDFGKAVTMLESQREAGRYLDTENMTVFKGTDNRCDRELYGLNNCCKTGGSDAMRMFSTLAMAAGAVESVGKVFSSYSYDSLFTAEQPEWASKGFSALTGTEMDSGLQTLLSGNLSVAQFIGSMAPGPWTMAMLAVQLSGLLNCSEDSQVTAMKRDAKLCHDVGDYCSGRDLLGGCIKRTRTFCCFPSKLGRIINEQGRPQLSGGWGTAQAPACGGFSTEELAQLDFSKMDLSEFYAEITRNSLELSTAEATVVQNKMTCYYGGGACGQ